MANKKFRPYMGKTGKTDVLGRTAHTAYAAGSNKPRTLGTAPRSDDTMQTVLDGVLQKLKLGGQRASLTPEEFRRRQKDPEFKAKVREWQTQFNARAEKRGDEKIRVDGIVGEQTAQAMGLRDYRPKPSNDKPRKTPVVGVPSATRKPGNGPVAIPPGSPGIKTGLNVYKPPPASGLARLVPTPLRVGWRNLSETVAHPKEAVTNPTSALNQAAIAASLLSGASAAAAAARAAGAAGRAAGAATKAPRALPSGARTAPRTAPPRGTTTPPRTAPKAKPGVEAPKPDADIPGMKGGRSRPNPPPKAQPQREKVPPRPQKKATPPADVVAGATRAWRGKPKEDAARWLADKVRHGAMTRAQANQVLRNLGHMK